MWLGKPQQETTPALRRGASILQGANNRRMGGISRVLEVDIRKFFDTLDHRHLRDILERRVRDGVILRLIGKWLKAGVMESGSYSRSEAGTPQGGVIRRCWRTSICMK